MKLILVLILMLPTVVFGQESRFLVKHAAEQNQIEVSAASAEYTSPGSYDYYLYPNASELIRKGNLVNLNYSLMLADLQQVELGGEMLLRQTKASGVRAVSAGYKGGTSFDEATLIYGADMVLSLGEALADNVFRGYHTFGLHTGIESYVGAAALSAEVFFESHVRPGRTRSNGAAGNEGQAIGLRASAELPVYRRVTAGVGLSVSQSTAAIDPLRLISGESKNGFSSKLFSAYAIDNQSDVSLNIYNEKLAAPMDEKTSLISLNYSRSL